MDIEKKGVIFTRVKKRTLVNISLVFVVYTTSGVICPKICKCKQRKIKV
jgi:hypothetical protein